MPSISQEEFLKLIKSIQFEDVLEEDFPSANSSVWTLSGIDILDCPKDQIQEVLYNNTNLKIGEFIVRIEEYHGKPNLDKTPPKAKLTMDIGLWQERYITPSGTHCKMLYKMDLFQDNRFTDRPWITYFNSSGKAHNIPVDVIIDIIKHLQVIQKLSCFL